MIYTSASSIAAKGMQFAAAIVSIPLLINYLTHEDMAVYLACAAITGMINAADLGLTFGLINRVATADLKAQNVAIGTLVAQTFAILVVWALLICVIGIGAFVFDGYTGYLALPVSVRSILIPMSLGIGISIPLSIFGRVVYSVQRGYILGISELAGHILGLVALWFMIQAHLPLQYLVCALFAPAIISNATCMVIAGNIFREFLGTYRARSLICLADAVCIIKGSLRFLLVQIGLLSCFAFDNAMMVKADSPSESIEYGLYLRIMGMIVAGQSMLIGPMWPAIAQARAHGDRTWVNRAVVIAISASVAFGLIMAAGLALCGDDVLRLWTRGSVQATHRLATPFALWLLAILPTAVLGIIVNSLPTTKAIIVLSALAACAILPMKYAGFVYGGSIGLGYASLLTYVLFMTLPLSILAGIGMRNDQATRG